MWNNGRARMISVATLVLIAAISSINLFARPRFHTYNMMDVVQTAGIGMCFGVAVAVLLGMSRKSVNAQA